MRARSTAGLTYSPAPVPTDPAQLGAYLADELQGIAAVLAIVSAGQVEKTHVAPPRPRDGMVRLADGTSWNPGSGQGVYAYYNGAWRLLG